MFRASNENRKGTLFITGGLGYLGSALSSAVLKKGYSVVLFDALVYGQNPKDILRLIAKNQKAGSSLIFIRGDTRNKANLEKVVRQYKPKMLIHFGELVGVYACNQNPKLTRSINYDGSRNAVDVAERNNIPLLYNSSSSIYGQQKKNILVKENNTYPPPTDYYCKYKLLIEKYISRKLKHNSDFRAIVFRPATVCGMAPRPRLDLLPNHFTYCAVAKKKIKIDKSNSYRAFMDVEDLIAGYLRVIEGGQWKSLIYNIGHYNIKKIDCARRIQNLIPCSIVSEKGVGDTRNLMIDSSKFEKEFGWKPKISLAQTIKQVAVWIRKNQNQIEKARFKGVINMPFRVWEKLI